MFETYLHTLLKFNISDLGFATSVHCVKLIGDSLNCVNIYELRLGNFVEAGNSEWLMLSTACNHHLHSLQTDVPGGCVRWRRRNATIICQELLRSVTSLR